MYSWTRIVLIAACCSSSPASAVWGAAAEWQGAAVKIASEEFVFTDAPFPSAHASTIVETPTGLIAAWFGGTREKHPDVGIWVSRHGKKIAEAIAAKIGPVQPLPPEDPKSALAAFTVPGLLILHVHDGLITRARDYMDGSGVADARG